MFWLFAAVLTAIVAIAILWPFRRVHAVSDEPAAAYDLRVYRDQLAEVERDHVRGIIDQAEAERLRTEIGRKVLDADRALGREVDITSGKDHHRLMAAGILGLLLVGGVGLYTQFGRPAQPDMALNTRIAMAEARYAARPTQSEAELVADPPPALPSPDPEYARLMEQLRGAVRERPDDLQGLALLARNEARLGNTLAAKEAQGHLVDLLADKATAADHAFLAGLMAETAGGLITAEAEAELAQALRINPGNEQARYMAGLLQAQNGRPDRAFPIWADLLQDASPDSSWSAAIRPVIRDMAWLAGQPDYVMPEPAPAARQPGPDADQMAAAVEMSPEDRAAFVRSMVVQLESRLATEGGTPEEWARLISSLSVIGETARAREILAEARVRFADTAEALALINDVADKAGIAE
ncbi:MAG: c-type cytochrome biogenesis protein CcmI [Paracoccus sp. (in: a-proteobacteria)]